LWIVPLKCWVAGDRPMAVMEEHAKTASRAVIIGDALSETESTKRVSALTLNSLVVLLAKATAPEGGRCGRSGGDSGSSDDGSDCGGAGGSLAASDGHGLLQWHEAGTSFERY
jgi:uncharacterized membrane protein YgcG